MPRQPGVDYFTLNVMDTQEAFSDIYNDENQRLRKCLAESWRENKFCDLTLKTVDGTIFQVHKNVVCSLCEYFRTKFSADSKDNKNNIIEMEPNIFAEDFSLILEYIYTGSLDILKLPCAKVVNLYKLAKFLKMDSLKHLVGKYLMKSVSLENCLIIWRAGAENEDESLVVKSLDLIKRNCLEFFNKYLSDLAHSELIKILSFNDSTTCTEQELYTKSIKWIKEDFAVREQYLEEICENIKFESIPIEFIKNNILDDEILYENKYFVKIMIKELSSRACSEADVAALQAKNKGLKKSLGIKPFNEVDIDKSLLLITENDFNKIDMSNRTVVKLFESKREHSFCCTKFHNDNIFFAGGMNSSDCEYFSKNKFYNLPSMFEPRWKHSMLYYHDKIYSCGGVNTNTTEIFDLHTMQWLKGPPLNYKRHSFGLYEEDGIFYAIGGYCETTSSENFIEKFDPRENKWKKFWIYNWLNSEKTKVVRFKGKPYGITSFFIYEYNIENVDFRFSPLANYSGLNIFEPFQFNDNLYIFGRRYGKFVTLHYNELEKKMDDLEFPDFHLQNDIHIC